MNDINDGLVNRLKKILTLAGRGGTPEEGEAALLKAKQIATEHGLDLAKIAVMADNDDKANKPEEINEWKSGYIKHEGYKYAARVVQDFLGVRWFYSAWGNKGSVTFLGPMSQTTYAEFLYGWLLDEFTRQWKSYRRNYKVQNGVALKDTRERKAFYYGLSNGLSSKVFDISRSTRKQKIDAIRRAKIDDLIDHEGLTPEQAEEEATTFATAVDNKFALMIVDDKKRTDAYVETKHKDLRKGKASRGFNYGKYGAIASGRAASARVTLPGRPVGDRGRLS